MKVKHKNMQFARIILIVGITDCLFSS